MTLGASAPQPAGQLKNIEFNENEKFIINNFNRPWWWLSAQLKITELEVRHIAGTIVHKLKSAGYHDLTWAQMKAIINA